MPVTYTGPPATGGGTATKHGSGPFGGPAPVTPPGPAIPEPVGPLPPRAASPEVPHLRWPLRLAAGQLLTIEQDTIDDVEQCVHVLLTTPLGTRPLAPDVGTVDPAFTGADPADIQDRLADSEPRAQVTVTVDGAGPEHTVAVQVALTETQEG